MSYKTPRGRVPPAAGVREKVGFTHYNKSKLFQDDAAVMSLEIIWSDPK